MPLTTVSQGLLSTDAQYTGFKNRIINGAMQIWQRATSSTSQPGYVSVDRFGCINTSAFSRSTDVPTGFQYSLEFASSSATFPVAYQRIESANCIDLAGQQVTLSFWAKNISGASTIFSECFYANSVDNFSSTTALGNFQVSASNPSSSWTFYSGTITLPAQAANGIEIRIVRSNAAAATTRITGVQLEKGSTATSFDYRPYGTELALCQRYAIKLGGDTANVGYMAFGLGGNTTTALLFYYPQTAFRTTPSLASFTGLVIDDTNGAISISGLVLDPNGSSPNFVRLNATATGLTQFRPYFLRSTASTGNLVLSAEL